MEAAISGPSILGLEDDPRLRASLRRTLWRAGWRVRVAAHGAEALRLVGERAPDLVLSDVDMPVMDGVELGRALTSRRPGLPIVFMSGNPETQTRALSPHFLSKPFSLESLEQALDGALAVRVRMAAG